MDEECIKNILIVKLGAIGDVIFSTPLIRAIKKKFQKSKISYLTTSWSKDIIECNPYLDEVLVFKNVFATILDLRKKKFDIAFILHRTIFSNLFIFFCNIPERIGFNYKNNGLFLTKKVYFNLKKHEVDRYLDLALACDIKPEGINTEIEVPIESKEEGRKLLSKFNLKKDDLKIGILAGGGNNPGTFMPIKRLEEEKLSKIADRLIKKFNAKVIFVGDSEDYEYAKKIILSMEDTPIDLVGKTTKKQLLGVLSELSLFIACDSGPLHIAASLGIPTVGIFGPSDPELVAPRGEKHIYVWKAIKCSPCYNPVSVWERKDFSTCQTETFECMKLITSDDVLSAVEKLGVRS